MRTKFNSSGQVALTLAAAMALAGITTSGLTAHGSTATWTGGGGSGNNNWSDTANWSGGSGTGGIPGTDDTVDFGTSSSLSSSNDISSLSIGELIFGYPADGPDAFTLSGNALTITTDGYNAGYGVYSGAYNITETINNDINFNGNSNIRETSSGTLVLGGTITGTGNLGLNGGSGAITLDDSSKGNDTFITGDLTGINGVVNVEAGNYTFGLGAYQLSGTVNLTGGTLTLGSTSSATTQNGTNTFNVNGGTLAYNGFYRGAGVTTVNTGGTLSVADSSGFGTRISTDSYNGTLTLAGGTATFTGNAITVNDAGSTNTGTINLDSGTLNTPGLVFNGSTSSSSPGTAVVNSNGGTLEFSEAYTITASTNATWNVLAGGAVINTDGNTVTIDQALVSGVSADGGLTKDGLGTLKLASTANTYNGNTTVNLGTLEINSNFLASTSTVSIAANAVMDLNYSSSIRDIVKALFLNGVSQGPGTYGAGAGDLGSGYFSGTGTLTVESSDIPEPATLAMMAVAGIGLLTIKRRKKIEV
jgi:autotransporter-associated beta strand protein